MPTMSRVLSYLNMIKSILTEIEFWKKTKIVLNPKNLSVSQT